MQTQSTFADAGWVFVNYETGQRGWFMPAGSYPLMCRQNPAAAMIPDITYMTVSEAQTALTGAGLTPGNIVYVNSWQVPEDRVAGLSASIGGYVDRSHPVEIYISGGSSGDGSEVNPYEIACQADMEAVNDYPSSHYIMTSDIFFGYHVTYTTSVVVYLFGSFDGNGHIINNLTIDTAGRGFRLGLFGWISE